MSSGFSFYLIEFNRNGKSRVVVGGDCLLLVSQDLEESQLLGSGQLSKEQGGGGDGEG